MSSETPEYPKPNPTAAAGDDPEDLQAIQADTDQSNCPPARELYQPRAGQSQDHKDKKPNKGWSSWSTMTKSILVGSSALSLALAGTSVANNISTMNRINEIPDAPPIDAAPVAPEGPAPITDPIEVLPAPTAEAPAPEADYTNVAAEFDMTTAEFQSLVDSFKISRAENPTPADAVQAFNQNMIDYFAVGHTAEDEEKYLEWSSPNISQPGWNSRSTEVATAAILAGMFEDGYADTEASYIETMKGLKTQMNRLWVNANDIDHSPDYVSSFEFSPDGSATATENGGFIVIGTITYTDNAENFPSTEGDSYAIGAYTFSDQSVEMAPRGDNWIVTGLVAGPTVAQ